MTELEQVWRGYEGMWQIPISVSTPTLKDKKNLRVDIGEYWMSFPLFEENNDKEQADLLEYMIKKLQEQAAIDSFKRSNKVV